MSSDLITTNQNNPLALSKAKNLLDTTKKILSQKNIKDLVENFKYRPFVIENKNYDQVYSIAISPDGKKIVSGSQNGSIKFWDILNGKCLLTLNADTAGSLAISSDGNILVSGGSLNGMIYVWDTQSGQCLHRCGGNMDGITGVGITPDGNTIISKSGPTVDFWDMQNGKHLNSLSDGWMLENISSFILTPDGKTIISGGGADHPKIKFWDINSVECFRILEGHGPDIYKLAITPDGNTLIYKNNIKTIKILEIQTGEYRKTFEGHSDFVGAIAISPDGKRIVSGSVEGSIKIWDIRSGECLKTFKGHSDYVHSIAISPDGKRIVSSNDNSIKIWDIHSGSLLYSINNSNEVAMDEKGYFNTSDEAIDQYIRVSEAPQIQRKLTKEEIDHFRKKGNFIEI